MVRVSLVATALLLTLSACGGSSGDSSSGVDEGVEAGGSTDGLADGIEDTDIEVQDDDLIDTSDDGPGDIPDTSDVLADSDGDITNPIDSNVVSNSEELDSDELTGTDNLNADDSVSVVNGSFTRAARWRSAFDQEPSADVSNRDDLLATWSELSRYDYVFEIADLVESIEQRIADGDAAFDVINVTIDEFERTHLCSGGGRLLSTNSTSDGLKNLRHVYEGCILGDQQLNGSFSIRQSTVSRNTELSTVVGGSLIIIDGSSLRAINASVEQTVPLESNDGSYKSEINGSYLEGVVGETIPTEIGEISTDPSLFRITFGGLTLHSFKNPEFSSALGADFIFLSNFFVVPGEGVPTWIFDQSFGQEFRGETINDIEAGQMILDTQLEVGAELILQADNGDPDSFDLIGFSDNDTVGSAVYQWGDVIRIRAPRLYGM